MWMSFLQNASSLHLCRPFVDFSDTSRTTKQLNFASDASLNKNLGMGAVFDNSWIVAIRLSGFIDKASPSIEFLELFALTVALLTWR